MHDAGHLHSRGKRETWRAILTFLLLTCAIGAVFDTIGITNPRSGNGYFTLGGMWGPGVAALCTCAILKRDPATLGWRWNWRFQATSYLVPFAYTAVAYAFVWASGFGHFYDPKFVASAAHAYGCERLPTWGVLAVFAFFQSTYGMIVGSCWALGEEIGWRGFLVPELSKVMGFTATAVTSGVIWAVWHYPVALFFDSNMNAEHMRMPLWLGLGNFTLMIVAMSFSMAWLRLKSGSLWTGMLFHASHNVFIQDIFTPLTADAGKTQYFVDEFGFPLIVTTWIAAVVFWRRRRELPVASPDFSPPPAR